MIILFKILISANPASCFENFTLPQRACDEMDDVHAVDINAKGKGGIGFSHSLMLDSETSEISICLWFFPMRLQEESGFLTIHSVGDVQTKIKFNNGNFEVDENTIAEVIPLGRWNYMCFIFKRRERLFFFQHKLTQITESANEITVDANSEKLMLEFGESTSILNSFSGLISGIHFFPRMLEIEEMVQVKNMEEITDDLHITNSCEALDVAIIGKQKSPYDERAYGDLKDVTPLCFQIHSCTLLNDLDDHTTVFSIKESCQEAITTCKNLRGALPSTDLKRKINFDFVEKISTTWILNQREKLCKVLVYNIYSQSFTIENKNSETNTFICLIAKDTIYHFRMSDNLIKDFKLLDSMNFIFEATTSLLQLSVTNDQIAQIIDLKLEHENDVLLSTPVRKNHLMGRHTWNYESDFAIDGFTNEENVVITFSTCTDLEFTCSNGACIELNIICNYENNCDDGSDEEFCNAIGEFYEHYDKRLSPAVAIEQKHLPLDIHLSLDNVIKFDINANSIVLSLTLTAIWKDHRVTFKNLRQNSKPTTVKRADAEDLWNPRIYMPTASTSDREKFYLDKQLGHLSATAEESGEIAFIDGYEVFVYYGKNVVLAHKKSSVIDFHCKMNLLYYPFDHQTCSIPLEFHHITHKDAEFNRGNGSISFSEDLPLYSDLSFKVKMNEEDKTKVIAVLSVKRKSGAFILNTYLPCLVLEFIGMLSFLVPYNCYSDRITVTLSCLIVMACLFTTMSASLPLSAASKMIDVWMFVHVAVLFLMFLVHVLVIYFHNKQTEKEEEAKVLTKMKKKMKKLQGTQDAWIPINLLEENSKQTSKLNHRWINIGGLVLCSCIYVLFLVVFCLSTVLNYYN